MKNENLRIQNYRSSGDDSHQLCLSIYQDNKLFWGQSIATAVVWNNLIGCNMENEGEWKKYLNFVYSQGLHPGEIEIRQSNSPLYKFALPKLEEIN